MSIQSEIARIESAKAEIIAAIERKGVDVPGGVKIENLPQYIDAIVCGNASTAKLGSAIIGVMKLGG